MIRATDKSSSSKNKIPLAMGLAILYTAIMGVGMYIMHHINGGMYGNAEMVDTLWWILIILTLLTMGSIVKFFSWPEVGFKKLNWSQLWWALPWTANIIYIWFAIIGHLMTHTLGAEQWRTLGMIAFTTLLVGIAEELMYRGIALHSLLGQFSLRKAILLSALAFSLLHSVNFLGGLAFQDVLEQLIDTFIFGVAFACLVLRQNNLWPAILLHWQGDCVAFLIGYLAIPDHQLQFYGIFLFAGRALTVLLLVKAKPSKAPNLSRQN